jgi:hypothetical protein
MSDDQDATSAPINWGRTPPMDSRDFHNEGGQRWRYDASGVFLENASQKPLRTNGNPTTANAILAAYGTEIFSASMTRRIPPELIVMTIAVETAAFRSVNFTGPKTFRWEQGVTSYSAGPMQILESTAKDVIAKLHLVFAREDIPPHFSSKPGSAPSSNPLYDGDTNIGLGVDYINLHTDRTGLDPILVAANYNAGSLRRTAPSAQNPWGLVTFGNHLDRAAEWFGDACAVLTQLRLGQARPSDDIDDPVTVDEEDKARQGFDLSGLTRAEATEQAEDYRDSGARVIEFPEEEGLFTLSITYPRPVADPDNPPPPPPAGDIQPPDMDGYVICIERRAVQGRAGKTFKRTVGEYQAFFNRRPVPDIHGTAVERQGPGDNTGTGVEQHRRLEAGTYPLFTHAGAANKYRTLGFANPGGLQVRPWPSIRIGNTNARSGVLIHCAAGYLMSIGCINLTGRDLRIGRDDIEFFDSRSRVIALIKSMKFSLGTGFPSSNNTKIASAALVIRGEPKSK